MKGRYTCAQCGAMFELKEFETLRTWFDYKTETLDIWVVCPDCKHEEVVSK